MSVTKIVGDKIKAATLEPEIKIENKIDEITYYQMKSITSPDIKISAIESIKNS